MIRVGKENSWVVGWKVGGLEGSWVGRFVGWAVGGFSFFCHSELDSESSSFESFCTFQDGSLLLCGVEVPKVSFSETLVSLRCAHHFSCFISTQAVSPPELP